MVEKETHRKAVTRVAQWLNLPEEKEQEFIDLAHEISALKDTDISQYDEEYLQHLEGNVFTDDSLLDFLQQSGIDSGVIEKFESQSIPFKDIYQSWNEIRYSTNEILDLTMLLKLINQYSEQSDSGVVDSRYKLQKLVYLVNRELVERDRTDSDTVPYDHGKLEKTGFRYTYRKRRSGPYSRNLDQDKNRLYASNLIDEELVQNGSTPEINEKNGRFEISLGASGRVMMKRFSDLLENLENDVLSEWEDAINLVVTEFGSMTAEELQRHITGIDDVANADDRDLLIRGRKAEYDSEPWLKITGQGVEISAGGASHV